MNPPVLASLFRIHDARTAELELARLIQRGVFTACVEQLIADTASTPADLCLAGVTLESFGLREMFPWGQAERDLVRQLKQRFNLPTTNAVERDWPVEQKFDYFRMLQRLDELRRDEPITE